MPADIHTPYSVLRPQSRRTKDWPSLLSPCNIFKLWGVNGERSEGQINFIVGQVPKFDSGRRIVG
jgi:hypothetical protein